jgi:hypothetical protein
MIEFKKVRGEEFLQGESIKGGSARLSNTDQSNITLLHSHMEGKESVDVKNAGSR